MTENYTDASSINKGRNQENMSYDFYFYIEDIL